MWVTENSPSLLKSHYVILTLVIWASTCEISSVQVNKHLPFLLPHPPPSLLAESCGLLKERQSGASGPPLTRVVYSLF